MKRFKIIKIDILLERLQASFLTLSDFLMAVIAQIARRISKWMDVVRLNFRIRHAEDELNGAYARLGLLVFQWFSQSRNRPLLPPEIERQIHEIQLTAGRLQSTGQWLSHLKDENFLYQFDEFFRVFKRSGSTIRRITIPMTYRFPGRNLRDLELPHGAFVLGLQHQDRMIAPSGDAAVYPGDHLFVLVPAQALEEVQRVFEF